MRNRNQAWIEATRTPEIEGKLSIWQKAEDIFNTGLAICLCVAVIAFLGMCVHAKYFCDGIVSQKANKILWVFNTITLLTLAIYATMYLLRWWAPRYMYTL